MSKSIIARIVTSSNQNVETANKMLAGLSYPGRAALHTLFETEQARATLDTLISADMLTYEDVKFEFEGGSAFDTSKLIVSCMRTAYLSAYHSWCREQGLYTDLHQTPAEQAAQDDIEQASGLHKEEFEHITFEEAIASSQAVYSYGHHIASYKEREFSWLLSMDITEDGETRTVRQLVPIVEWARSEAERSESPKRAEFMRIFAQFIEEEGVWHHMPIDLSLIHI